MNNGFYTFPTGSSQQNQVLSIKEFDTSGTFVIPTGTRRVFIMCIGAGGGAGGGARGNGASSYGGGGGAGGQIIIHDYAVDALGTSGTTLTVVIGAGGSGGAGGTTNGSAGIGGVTGSNSSVTVTGKPGLLMQSQGGGAGGGGSVVVGGSGGTGRTYIYQGIPINVANVPTSSGTGATATTASFAPGAGVYNTIANGGGAGGGVFSGIATTGAGITAGNPIYTGTYNPYWGAGNNQIQPPTVNTSTAATDNVSLMSLSAYAPGLGGSSGSGSTVSAAGNGGKGWRGGGGGAGGGSASGFNAGNGASGGDGYVVIVAYS